MSPVKDRTGPVRSAGPVPWINVDQAAELLKTGRKAVYKAAERKLIRSKKRSKFRDSDDLPAGTHQVLFERASVEARARQLEARKNRPPKVRRPPGHPKGLKRQNWPTPAEVQALTDVSPIQKAFLLARVTNQDAAQRITQGGVPISNSHLGSVLAGKARLSDDVAMAAQALWGVDFCTSKVWHHLAWLKNQEGGQ